MPLRWCGFAYKYFERQLGEEQYFPSDADAKPENRLFAQCHAPQTTAMKQQILKELSSSASKVRLIFATVAMGMGVDIKAIRQVIHVGNPGLSENISKRLDVQAVMENSLLVLFITITETFQRIGRD